MTLRDHDIILFTYPDSVFGRKLSWYLYLRSIPFSQCIQPNRIPRPDLESLGICYRRIPILAIGRDIYIDTRLIIEKLERLFPDGALGSKNPFEQGLEKILQTWTMDGGPFWRTAQCIPPESEVARDREWCGDRSEMISAKFDGETLKRVRPEALAHQRLHIETLEHGLLADGRDWLLGGPLEKGPTLADLHAVWTFEWLTGESMRMGENLEMDLISDCRYPRLYSWIDRAREAVDLAKAKRGGEAKVIDGQECIEKILSDRIWEREGNVDETDPLRLKKGQVVEVFPLDSGYNHHDTGELVSLCAREIVIASKVRDGEGFLRLHFPRLNFRVQPFV